LTPLLNTRSIVDDSTIAFYTPLGSNRVDGRVETVKTRQPLVNHSQEIGAICVRQPRVLLAKLQQSHIWRLWV